VPRRQDLLPALAAFGAGRSITKLTAGDCDVRDVLPALVEHPTITSLTLSGTWHPSMNGVRVPDEDLLRYKLAGPGHFRIDLEGVQALPVTSLSLNGIRIGNEGVPPVVANPSIRELDVGNCCIGGEGALTLANSTRFTSLNLGGNDLLRWGPVPVEGERPIESVLPELAPNTSIPSLDLSHCNILLFTDEDLEGLRALGRNNRIKSVILKGNAIGDAGAGMVAADNSVPQLDASYCGILDGGVMVLAANTSFRRLNLEGNFVQARGFRALAQSTWLTSLDVSYPGGQGHPDYRIGNEGPQILRVNSSLTSLRLAGQNIGCKGAKAVATMRALTEVDLSDNRIRSPGAKALAANPRLTKVNVSKNQIGVEGKKALEGSTSITWLDVSGNEAPMGKRVLEGMRDRFQNLRARLAGGDDRD